MRDIRFRGKRKEDGEWLYGDLYHVNEQTLIKPMFNEPYEYPDDYDQNVDVSTVGQYTGLKDRNGVKIYEGDVIDCPSRPNRIGYGYVIDNLPELYYDILDLAIVGDDIEVVGNIYESKEE